MILLKIFLFTPKKLLTIFFLILIPLLLLSYFIFSPSITVSAELNYTNQVSNEFLNRINNLTKGEEKIAYLTFDDGPNIQITPKVLDILKSENVKASFFVIGKNVEAYPEIVKRAYEEGNYIANHGYSHNNSILYKNSESFVNEIRKTDLAIRKSDWSRKLLFSYI